MIRACIFDFDGVLADTEALHYQSYQMVLAPRGLGFDYETYRARYMAFDSRGCLRQLLRDLDRSETPATLALWAEEKNAAYLELLAASRVPPLPGALMAVAFAAARGPVAVCTGAVRSDVDPLLDALGLRPLLQALVTADDVAVSKPDPESYRLAAARLEMDPALCLAIEDTPGGLRSARGAGCRTLAVATSHPADLLCAEAESVIPTLLEFPAAFSRY